MFGDDIWKLFAILFHVGTFVLAVFFFPLVLVLTPFLVADIYLRVIKKA